MYVNQSKKMIFFHNPKTGGRSATEILGFKEEPHLKFIHMSAVDAKRRIFQEEWPQYFSFAFVRNPWERMVSLYAYQRSVDYGLFLGFNQTHQIARLYDFPDWLKLNLGNKGNTNWFGIPQTEWTQGVTEVFQFEAFEDSLREVCDQFDIQFKSVHKNKTDRLDYKSYYPSIKEIDIVAKIDAKIISQFKYGF